MGVLSAIADRVPDLSIPILSGVSAGAINTVTLAAHPGTFKAKVRALRNEWWRLTVDQVYHPRLGSLVGAAFRWLGRRVLRRRSERTVVRGLLDMEPLRHFLTARVHLAGIEANIAAGRLRAVTLSATSYRPSETVTFVQGADDLSLWERAQRRAVRSRITWDHVMASAAIPIFFPAVKIGDRYYGDGSVRQAAPLAPPIHLGASRILAIGMRPRWDRRYPEPTAEHYPSAAQVMGMLFHSIFLDALETDAERLGRLNAVLDSFGPDRTPPNGLRPVKLLVIRPAHDLGAMARPHLNRLPPVMRSVVQSMGGDQARAADFLSYLMFDPAYTKPVMEMGYRDACDQWSRIERFLSDDAAGSGPPGGCETDEPFADSGT